jgi:hypothetical protein
MLNQLAFNALLERGETPRDGGLADTKSFRRRERAALSRDRKKVTQIVPIEHACGPTLLSNDLTDSWLPTSPARCYRQHTVVDPKQPL